MNHQSPRELLTQFYIDSNLELDGGQGSPNVKIEMGKFYFYIPNFDARRKAVIKHDIHHLLTGYSTDIKGEAEISAWEIASGCTRYWAAFVLNTSGVMMGFWMNFSRTLKAFARGRKTKNLYNTSFSTEDAMDMRVGDLKAILQLDQYPIDTKVTFIDVLLFLIFALFGGIFSLLSLLILPLVILYTIYTIVKIRLQKK
ncbi:MAG: hypothetical protein ACKOXB_02805 [Flavobacteriales bacterium]